MRIEAVVGDITREHVDVIVNAANSSLLGGGGVDRAIHRAAGPRLLEDCQRLRGSTHRNGLATGDAVATTAGDLPASWVIHTVGPRFWEHADGGADLLASCHRRSLEVASQLGASSVAFPAISCGAFGWTPDRAAPVAVGAVRGFVAAQPASGVEVVRFVLIDEPTRALFAGAAAG